MKYCPTCKTRYDEEILRFCMKDGTPLVEEEEPNFVEMPSEGMKDLKMMMQDEVTIIRKNTSRRLRPQSNIDDMPAPRSDCRRG